MKKNIKYIIIAFLVLVISFIAVIFFTSADVKAVYTRNTLTWKNADALEDGSVKLSIKNGKTTVRLENAVRGNIGFSVCLYTEKEISEEVNLTAKDVTEIDQNAYPASLKDKNVKGAFAGELSGKDKKTFTINASGAAEVSLLVVIEDNNSYPKEEKNIPAVANVKFSAEVLLDGQYPRGKDYSFSLKNAQGEVIETVKNDDGYITFSNIALKEKGEHVYFISQNEGKDKETVYDQSVYKITVVAEGKNSSKVFYEKDGVPRETLPRFSNYKEIKDLSRVENSTEYPTNEKKSTSRPNYLLWAAAAVAVLLVVFYIVSRRKKD